jgi:hypothetical protein
LKSGDGTSGVALRSGASKSGARLFLGFGDGHVKDDRKNNGAGFQGYIVASLFG